MANQNSLKRPQLENGASDDIAAVNIVDRKGKNRFFLGEHELKKFELTF